MLNFNQLRAVVALHDHRNFHRAAESISITQPALSLSIRKIEESLGQTLFDRSQRTVHPTDAGLLVVRHARDILGRFDSLENALEEFSGANRGEVEFGVAPYVVRSVFPAVIRRFCRAYPSIRPRFEVGAVDSLHSLLMSDQISLYVADAAMGEASECCAVESLFDEEIVYVARPGHPLANRRRVQAKDIVQFPFVAATDRASAELKQWFLSRLATDQERELMDQNHPFIVCDNYEATRALVLSTDYLTGGPAELVRKDTGNGRLIRIDISGFQQILSTGIVTRTDRTLSPAANALKQCFEGEYSKRSQPSARNVRSVESLRQR